MLLSCPSLQQPQASTLVVVEHRNSKVAAPTLNTLTAAGQLGGDVTALVGGKGVQQVAEQAAALPGVNKVSAVCPPAVFRMRATPTFDNTRGPNNQTTLNSARIPLLPCNQLTTQPLHRS